MRKPEVITTDNGFAIVTAKEIDAVALDEVRSIIAYKFDALKTDLVCCDIVTGVGDGAQIHTIHEALPGFDAAMQSFDSPSGFNRQWRDAVTLPHFATNRTVIYNRAACG